MKTRPKIQKATVKDYYKSDFHKYLTLLLLISMVFFRHTEINAQTPASPLDSYVAFTGGTGSVMISLPDTNTCSEIEVTLGSKSETGDLFAHVYTYDQSTGLTSGLNYTRDGANVTVGIGAVVVPPAYNVKIRLKNTSGNWSSWYEYITN